MSTTLTPETLDSCNVQVQVEALRPLPCTNLAAGTLGRHYALIHVVIGSMRVDGMAAFDESQAGVLVLAGPPEGVDCLPVMVQEVLTDLGSPHIAFRVREAVEAAVQQYDREMGALGDGPDGLSPYATFAAFYGMCSRGLYATGIMLRPDNRAETREA